MTDEFEETEELAVITDEVIEALDRIAKDDVDGIIQPETVIEIASDPASPLNKHFEWDDTEAGHAWRLHQARQLINKIKIIKVDQAPRYVNVVIKRVEGGQRRGYMQTERAVANPVLYKQVALEAAKGIRAYQIRLDAFARARKATKTLGKAITELTESVSDNEED